MSQMDNDPKHTSKKAWIGIKKANFTEIHELWLNVAPFPEINHFKGFVLFLLKSMDLNNENKSQRKMYTIALKLCIMHN